MVLDPSRIPVRRSTLLLQVGDSKPPTRTRHLPQSAKNEAGIGHAHAEGQDSGIRESCPGLSITIGFCAQPSPNLDGGLTVRGYRHGNGIALHLRCVLRKRPLQDVGLNGL